MTGEITNSSGKKPAVIVAAVVVVLVLAAAAYWWFSSRGAEEAEVRVPEAAESLEPVLEPVGAGTLPEVNPISNPLEKLPDINPVTKTNPFSGIKTNPF